MSASPQPPWHQRRVPFPYPAWLWGCLLSGVAISLTFYYGLGARSWSDAAYGFAFGFGGPLLFLCLFGALGGWTSDTSPPPWLRHPILIGFVVWYGVHVIQSERITWGSKYGGKVSEIRGPDAVAIGFAMIGGCLVVSLGILVARWRSRGGMVGPALGLLVGLIGMVLAVCRALLRDNP
jgi:hypothetical protein